MKERPILFRGPMVRAILEGRKTQTRRVVKDTGLYAIEERFHGKETADREKHNLATQCKYGISGDHLWVKETHQAHPIYGSPVYKADYQTDNNPVKIEGWPWRPSIFMPRKSSRITLEITDVRVERLQDISEEDAMSEGVDVSEYIECIKPPHMEPCRSAKRAYSSLWEEINGPGSWEANPWVWPITFKRIK